MFTYIQKIQRQFISVYGFKENPEKPGLPMNVPDGEYPMTIDDKLDHVRVKDGYINCCNFDEPRDPITSDPAAIKRVENFLKSGADPQSSVFDVNAEMLLMVVKNVAGVTESTKSEIISLLKKDLIRGRKVVGSFELGIFFSGLFGRIQDNEGLSKIIVDVKDLNKLPYVSELSN